MVDNDPDQMLEALSVLQASLKSHGESDPGSESLLSWAQRKVRSEHEVRARVKAIEAADKAKRSVYVHFDRAHLWDVVEALHGPEEEDQYTLRPYSEPMIQARQLREAGAYNSFRFVRSLQEAQRPASEPPELLVLGDGPLAEAVVIETLRLQHTLSELPPWVRIFEPQADRWAAQFRSLCYRPWPT